MKIESFNVTFEDANPEGVYFAGEEIKGKVTLILAQDSKINEYLLELKGGSKTHWMKSRKHFTAAENYFCKKYNTEYTWTFGETNERMLPKGKYVTPFSFKLPHNLPSSFESQYGHTR